MSRIAQTFKMLAQNGKKALIPYITAGDPTPNITVDLMHALVAAGADIIEVGVPFSDPMADGPIIQLACERALAHDTSLPKVLEMIRHFRQTNHITPVVLMGYMNPVENMGLAHFAAEAQAVGVDGVLLVDFPVEQAREVLPTLRKHALDCIFLIAPTSPAARIQKIAQAASGYLYYVSLKGVTGAATLDMVSVTAKLSEIRRLTDLPLAVGFGIRDASTAQAVSAVAEAVIVGSALVNQIAKDQASPALILQNVPALLRTMREAMDA